MNLIELTPEQKSRIEMAQIIRRSATQAHDYLNIWRSCHDKSIFAGEWVKDYKHHTADNIDELLSMLIGPYEGVCAEQFIRKFQQNNPILVELKEFCETNIAGFKVDLERLYLWEYISSDYTTQSKCVNVRATIKVVTNPTRLKINVSQTSNRHRDWSSIAYYRDMQEIIDLIAIITVQAKAMGLEVVEE